MVVRNKKNDKRDDNVLKWRFPLARSQCGIPMGNGMFGALVWGGTDWLCVTLNRADFWDHRGGELTPGEDLFEELKQLYDPEISSSMDAPFEVVGRARPKGAFRNTRLPMGRFEWKLREGARWSEGRLHFESGRLELLWEEAHGTSGSVAMALHPRESALWIADEGGVLSPPEPRPAWEWVSEAMESRGFVYPAVVNEETLRGWIQDCPEDSAMAALCERRPSGFVVVMAPGENIEEARCNAEVALASEPQGRKGDFFSETAEWWREYWKGLPDVSLPDPFFDHFLRFALFKFAGATSPESALPSGLQGPWCEEYQIPTWSGDYHFNVNIQQIYTLAFPCGKAAHLLPLFDMLERCSGIFREQARRMVGISDGLLMCHATDDRGYACGGVGPGACIDQAVSGWTAQLFWLYYRHTGDLEFLRDRAVPFMCGVMRVFEEMLEWDEGRPSLPISISAEYGKPMPDGSFHRVGPDASYQFACMHMLLDALLDAHHILGEAPRSSWVALKKALPQWTLVGEVGKERIGIWKDTDLEISHRHHSHLACVYPFDTLSDRTPEQQAIVERSFQRWLEVGMSDWSEWCLPWAAILQAREGYRESPLLLLNLCRELFMNEGLANVYIPNFAGFTLHGFKRFTGPLETCEIMQLDGTMGVATALYEMLAHTHRGMVRFFPAVPERWRDVVFNNIHLPGPLHVGGEKKNGVVVKVTLMNPSGGIVRLDVPGHVKISLDRKGSIREYALPLEIEMEAGEVIEGKPIVSAKEKRG